MFMRRPLAFFLLFVSLLFCYQPNLFAERHFGDEQIVPDSLQVISGPIPESSMIDRETNSRKKQSNNISLEYAGSTLWSQITDFEIKGDYAYCAMYNGLFIIDISDASNPTFVSKLYIRESVSSGIKLFDHYAAIVGTNVPRGSLSIIDISNPARPQRVGFATLASTGAYDIDVSGTTAYIGSGVGLLIADISNLSSPSFITPDTLFSARKIAIFNHYLYTTSNHFYILDISNPHYPALVSQFDTPGEANDFAIDEGKNAYITALSLYTPHSWSALVVLDINDPSAPTLKSTHTLPGSASGIAKSGNFVYMSNSSGLLIFDVSDTDTSRLVGSTPLPGYISQISVADTVAFISSKVELVEPEFLLMCDSCSCGELNNPARTIAGDLMIVNISEKTSPCLSQIFPSASTHLSAIATNAMYAFIGDDYCDSIMIVDISKADGLEKKGAIGIPGDLNTYAVNGNYLYVSYRNSGLNIYDITDPLHPGHLGKVSVPDGTHLEILDTLVFLGAGGEGFYIIDVSDLSNPYVIGHYAGNAVSFKISGEYAYLVGLSGFLVLSISNPSNPSLVGYYNTYATFIDIRGDLAYINDYWDYLTILDISAPTNPKPLGTILVGAGFHDLALFDNFCIAANSWDGLTVVDVSNPTSLNITNVYDTPGPAEAVLAVGRDIYVVDTWALIRLVAQTTNDVVDTEIVSQLPLSTELLSICPNPANSIMSIRYKLASTCNITLEIHNILGQKIRTLFEGLQNLGIHHIEWDGTDQNGKNVPSGVYFVRLQSGHSQSIQKATIIK